MSEANAAIDMQNYLPEETGSEDYDDLKSLDFGNEIEEAAVSEATVEEVVEEVVDEVVEEEVVDRRELTKKSKKSS